MKNKKINLNLPTKITVDVRKGTSGVLLARLPEYDVFTEADNLNELFFQVNDLIYTYFDIPKKYQNDVCFIPPRNVQEQLEKISSKETKNSYSLFDLKSLFSQKLFESHVKMNLT